ncbi:hypothetical protein JVX98_04215 (plasmid) [Ensifer sp. PDNC004]|uniref:hypothetical protein n=1 Tax=Ensifer sp. PDNC004 TaxID=2811423 RepID=UPI001964D6F9|nr:hypothetical protein [Ensifer sp. PDNC004]QRY64872.1 hypothetical protein JVX98_04215 [Ensifer sp. PDNC004]
MVVLDHRNTQESLPSGALRQSQGQPFDPLHLWQVPEENLSDTGKMMNLVTEADRSNPGRSCYLQ